MNPATGASDLRERSFQNVVETVLRPSGIKVGGFPEDMFLDLDENDKERLICNICYLIINECRQCDNSHAFCRSCIVAWSLTYGENARKCPFCRCTQDEYHPNKTIDSLIGDKRVRCLEEGCNFRAPVKIFLMHSHGKAAYSNAEVDFEKLKPPPAHLFVLPPFALSSRSGRVTGIREQLLQGRMMIQQMMLLMHLEMQLRQQALVSYQETNEPAIRMQRLDDVMALNEQLNEVGSILSMLLSTPINRVNDRETSRSQHAPPAVETPEVNDRMHRSSSDVLSALSSSANALAVNSMLPHSPLHVSSTDQPALLNRRVINATPPRLLSEVPQRRESQNVTTSLPFSLDTFSDVDDDDNDYEDRYIDSDYLWEESHRFQGLDNSRRVYDFDAASPRLRLPQEITLPRDLTTTSVSRITRSDQTNLHDQNENQDELTTAIASRTIQAPVDQRQAPLLSRDQESSVRLSGPEHSGGLSSARGFQSSATVSPRSELSARASLPRLTTLPRIQRTPRLVSSVELDEPDRTATETIEQHGDSHLAMDASPSVDTSLNLASSNQTSLRNNETTDQQQAMASTGGNTMLALPNSISASPPALLLQNTNSSMPRVLRQQEPIEAAMQPAIRSSRSRLLRQTSHPFQSQRTTSRPSLLQRTESQASETSQEHALPGSQTNGHRSTSKLTAVRASNAPSRPPLIQASLTQRTTLTQRPSLMQADVRLLNRSSPASAFPMRRSSQAIEHQQTPIPHPPGTVAPSTRRQSNQAPVAGLGRGTLLRSRRRSEIRQELRKSLRQDDD